MLNMSFRRCTLLFSKIRNVYQMPSFFSHSNIILPPSQSLRGIIPYSGKKYGVHYISSSSGYGGRVSSRLMQMQQVLEEAESRADHANEPIPKIALEHVRISFARSGGAGGQNVNKVSTKVDMRFHVMGAGWLPLRMKERILQLEKNRINSDGELVISSTKTRSQKDNIEDALGKLQAIIDAAAYVPPAPTEEKIKKIKKLAEISEQKRLQTKKVLSLKKAGRKNKASWE